MGTSIMGIMMIGSIQQQQMDKQIKADKPQIIQAPVRSSR
jgi:hypothetical protein